MGTQRAGARRYGAAFVLAALWFGSQRLLGGHSVTTQWISNVGLVLAPLLAAALCAWRGLRSHDARRAWVLLGLSAFSWGTGQAFWTVYESVLGRELPFPSYADFGYLMSVPLLVAGLLALPSAPTLLSGRLRLLLDGCLVALSLSMLSWQLVLAATVQAGGDTFLNSAISLAYPIGDLICGTVALIALARARHGSRVPTQVLLLLVAGSIFNAIADSGFAFLTLRGSYYSGHPIDLFWFMGYVVLGLAALVPETSGAEREDSRARRDLTLVGPYAVVLVAVATDIVKEAEDGKLGPFLAWGSIVLVLILVFRQVLAVRENALLTASLEARVIERTRALAEREAWFRTLVQNLSDVVTVVDREGVVTYQTPSAAEHFGRSPADSLGTTLVDWWTPFDAIRLGSLLEELARHPGTTRLFSGEVLDIDGSPVPVEATVTSFADDEHLTGFVINARDVTERRRLERELSHQAFHDSLTGLANRALFHDRVEHALATRARTAVPLAVLFLDLDGFKAVNDTFGHGIGDQLLEIVADRLSACVRPMDTVARFGGDEFAVLLETLETPTSAAEVASRIGVALSAPVELAGREVAVAASCGIALYGGDESADELLRNADLAMYRAKSRGGADFEVFEPGMHVALVERLELESDLRQALTRGELRLHYQPTVTLEDNRWVGTEALLRWESPTRGLVPPMSFISVAEDIGIIGEIGTWVLREACRQTARWRATEPELAALTVAVNVSPLQLVHRDFLLVVAKALSDAGLPPEALVIELTENILIERTEEMLGLLSGLKAQGVRLAIDDFGTGYSSLSYLSRFPVDILKIDRSFVSRLASGSEEEELTRTIVRLGQSLSLVTVAEGIEEQSQLDSLRIMGCELGQGYLFSRPVTPQALLAAVVATRL
jgi:diguanylate cyclase (GGDEF)-like protein/PAS domain S-box-containing protein